MQMKKTILGHITDFTQAYHKRIEVTTRWGTPLAAFVSARDPLFLDLKKAVSPTHTMPADLLEGAKTVIVYFLPFEKAIVSSNRKGIRAAREWAIAYIETNRLIVEINQHLLEVLQKMGYRAALIPPTHNFDKKRLISNWSHKHVAFIGGLGTFGVHRLLITERGCCGRLGSLVTDAPIEPTERKEGEFCLSKNGKSCLKCVTRCPVEALKENSFDRHRCYAQLLENAKDHAALGVADVCGKCSCIVPCSFHNPSKNRNSLAL